MKNVDIKQVGKKLVITVDLSADLGFSKTGKSRIIASTEGNERINANGQGEVYLGVNVYKKAVFKPSSIFPELFGSDK